MERGPRRGTSEAALMVSCGGLVGFVGIGVAWNGVGDDSTPKSQPARHNIERFDNEGTVSFHIRIPARLYDGGAFLILKVEYSNFKINMWLSVGISIQHWIDPNSNARNNCQYLADIPYL